CPQCDAASVDGAARDLGRDQYPLPVRLSVLDHLLRGRDSRDRRWRAVADRRVLAVAAAGRTQPDRRHRHDAAGDERPFVRGDDGLSETEAIQTAIFGFIFLSDHLTI